MTMGGSPHLALAGFVGIAGRGPLHTAVPVQSWRQFQAYFGDFTGAGYLAYAVRAFFENGGQKARGATRTNANVFANMTNAFNHPNYAAPSGVMSSPNFGKSTSAGEEAQVSAAGGAVARLVFSIQCSVFREKKPAKWAFPIVTDLA